MKPRLLWGRAVGILGNVLPPAWGLIWSARSCVCAVALNRVSCSVDRAAHSGCSSHGTVSPHSGRSQLGPPDLHPRDLPGLHSLIIHVFGG